MAPPRVRRSSCWRASVSRSRRAVAGETPNRTTTSSTSSRPVSASRLSRAERRSVFVRCGGGRLWHPLVGGGGGGGGTRGGGGRGGGGGEGRGRGWGGDVGGGGERGSGSPSRPHRLAGVAAGWLEGVSGS